MFRLPQHSNRTYAPINRCIYCGGDNSLSDEHIIPLGLGGRWKLPKASCDRCATETSAFEQVCQRTMLGPLRMYYDLPTRRRKDRPEKLPLKVKLTPEADWSYLDVDRKIYPFLLLLPIVQMPDVLSGSTIPREPVAAARTFWIRGASFRDGLMPHLEALASELKVAAIEPTGTVHVPEFFRMLAKIAHAFAIAELGVDAFTPFLDRMIRVGDMAASPQHIGGLLYTEQAVFGLHEVGFGTHTCDRPDIIAVRIRLLASLETPTYFVAVGQKKSPA